MSDKEQKKQSVKTILDNFRKNIFGIEYYYNKFGNLAEGEDSDVMNKTIEFITDCFKESGINLKGNKEKQKSNKISAEKLTNLARKLKKQPKISTKNYDILSKSSFLMLNNYFEYLLSDLLSYYYNKFQKSLNEKKFNLALKEINDYESIEEFTKSLITKEVESMMVELSFDELLEHFHTTLEINNEKDIINWNSIRECRERRHLIVHNSSVVNKKYITRSKNPFDLKVGDIINIDKDYFLKSGKEFFLAGLIISYNCWGKWDKELATEAITDIMVDSFELLKQKEYGLVSRFTNYTQKIEARNEQEEDYLLRNKVNRLIALKKMGDKDTLTKELKKMKVGTASPIFKLAFSILSDNHKNLIELVIQSKAIDELDEYKYNEWPIYDFVRDLPEIHTKIEAELKTTGTGNLVPKKVVTKKTVKGSAKPSSPSVRLAKPSKRKLTSTKN